MAYIKFAMLDSEHKKCDQNALASIDAMIHLAGASVADKRWTDSRKQEIANSRILGTRYLVSVLKAYAKNCTTLVSASAIGFYGPDRPGVIPFKEDGHHYDDFLASVCEQWENEAKAAQNDMRTICCCALA